ncbi:MAG: tRNA (N(6)-L-threonylcarbamoyladenosine(37)-C(2))-methylthiotransferase MtaB [Desulfobacteraceae bacterium]|nr:tRNA (N(6)-L-threonylcarbamoyladenosine(37)-C(2))-methylthiotransferase MtaB [Desulfobacterales bacterium]MBL6967775.1 tRNA (N(6)-L-threonylcarbamoyladenosine(37)-C(2))-methylthiotransferase MtaB [Desulfobacteraceae bacterium]MBL7101288.1 tRNA (N(6)-L-threonylcarbamoyladenosine(37)-C(2))-methylthiotransferase MtaB [Desulfobacteraceae bacterium]
MDNKKSFKVITLGCKVNQYESAYLNEALTGAGWRRADKEETGDVVIVNTCIVTQRAAHQSRQAIRKAIRENPAGYVAAIGCYAQAFPKEISDIEGVGLIADNRMKADVPRFLISNQASCGKTALLRPFEQGTPFDFLDIRRFPDRTRAYLKIQDGCQSSCSYCIVPVTRGPYRSLVPEKVLFMLETLSAQGYREVVLTGIHLGRYGVDLRGDTDLVSLLQMIGREGYPLRIRLSSIEPNEMEGRLIEMVASEPWLCRHFHIPLQSGDNRVLKDMNRTYTSREFAEIIERVCSKIPHVAIGVDIMSGFPGEDSTAHRNSYSLIKDLPLSYLHVFPFSPRPGTAANAFKGKIDPDVIKNRAAELRGLGERKRQLFYQRCLNKEFPVLAEGWASEKGDVMKGRSDNYLPVLFRSPFDSDGQLVSVRMERVEGNMIVGSATRPLLCPT